ncbi:uncharacterized protein LOC130112927 [Lampris incognitus]|uniref:uncharacterized protein LOC130112927 n=1 Tax=Lampris incognitus TaxID=2546036 RepID=UPI0024B62BBE|nr:uncharacterized protein LOC130112927 [Lampris incognitus]
MEDYNEFVQNRLSQLRESKENQPSARGRGFSDGTSLIRFYGRRILPPLLSGKQREEIQRLKTTFQNSIEQRKSKADAKVACVQNILHTVQLRKVPTLEEFFHEDPELPTLKSSYSHFTSNALMSHSDDVRDTRDSLLFSPLSGLHDGRDGIYGSPLTSTKYCALSDHRLTSDQCEEKLPSQPTTDPPADISHQSLSSGYVTYDNAENGTSVSAKIEPGEENHEFDSEQEAKNMGAFFLHKTSDTITKIPDIISHPPIDGEELERCAMRVSVYDNFIMGHQLKDNSPSPQHNSVIVANSVQLETSFGNEVRSPSIGASKITHLGSRDCEAIPLFSQINELGQVQNTIGDEGTVHEVKTSCCPKSSHSPATIHTAASANQTQIQCKCREVELMGNQVNKTDSKPFEKPYRFSLQALLKKSQEYRRHQRMIRNQTKNSKVQETAQEKLEKQEEKEEDLSDKENDEFPKGTLTTERGKTEENGELGGNHVHFLLPVEMSPKNFWEDDEEKISRSEPILVEYHGEKSKFKSQSKHMTEDGNTEIPTGVEGETPFNQLDNSQEVRTEPTQMSTFSELQSDNSLVPEAFSLTNKQNAKYILSSSKNVGKFQTVPTPKLSMSPVCFKSKGDFKVSRAIENTGAPKRKVLANTALNEDNKVKTEINLGQKSKRWLNVFPTTCQASEGDVARVSARSADQAQQIHQLELNLSSLKDLISDLESTLVENMESHWQADYLHLPGDFCCKGIQHIEQTDTINKDQQIGQNNQKDCDHLEDRPAAPKIISP